LKLKYRAIALNGLLNQKKKLDDELEKEIRALNQKYEKMALPLYEKSSEIVGGRAPKEDELVDLDKYLTQEEIAKKGESLAENDPIKDYWQKVFKNNEILGEEMKEKDVDVIKHLTKIEYIKIDESEYSFELRFHFEANDYFTNDVLKKTFYMKEEDLPEKSVGTEIAWKEGKNITKKTIKKKQKNKKTGQTRVITKEVDEESFFNFFKSINLAEAKKEQDDDDEEADLLHERMDIDLDIGRTIVEEAIPYGLEYYLGIKLHDHAEGLDDEEDDEDDEDSEEEYAKKKGKKPHKH
jgi:nucleosome assembly protein 1-like 1